MSDLEKGMPQSDVSILKLYDAIVRLGGHHMFGIGVPELIIILVVALIIFGPGKLPEIGSALGKGIRDFRRSFEGRDEDVKKVQRSAESAEQPPPSKS